MRYNATLVLGSGPIRAMIEELSGVAGRQIADRGELANRAYAGWTDRTTGLIPGMPVTIAMDSGERFITYLLIRKGRNLRLQRRDGEFMPGVVLERLGVYEQGAPQFTVGGDGWYACVHSGFVVRTTDFLYWEYLQVLNGILFFAAAMAGREVVLGESGRLFASTDGTSWQEIALTPEAGDVEALAWDGTYLWAATSGALVRVLWSTRTAETVATGAWCALSEEFATVPPYRALTGSPGFSLYTNTGGFYRTVSLEASPIQNLVRYGQDGSGPRFVTVDQQGGVWDVGRTDERLIGSVMPTSFQHAKSAHRLRGRIVLLAFGKLCWTDGDEVIPVHDFGCDVAPAPGLYGPVLTAGDGVLYRVARI